MAFSVVDKLNSTLRGLGFSGSIPDMMFRHLRSLGHTGTTPDMLSKEGGYKDYVEGLILVQRPTFNGIDQYLTIPAYQNASTTFSFEFNIKPSSIGSTMYLMDSSTENNYVRVQTTGNVRARFADGVSFRTVSSSTILQVGVTYNVRVEATPTSLELFINNISEASVVLSTPLIISPVWSSVGVNDTLSVSFFDGMIYGVSLSGTRNYPMEDTFANDPVAIDTISSQNGTYIGLTSGSWS